MASPEASRSARTSAAFVTGLAWVFVILAGWACIRLTYMLATSFEVTSPADINSIGLSSGWAKALMIIHLLIAAFTLYAARALMQLRAWTRLYFATLLVILGGECCLAGTAMALRDDPTTAVEGLQTINLIASLAIIVLGFTCFLLAYKFVQDKGIKQVLVGRSSAG